MTPANARAVSNAILASAGLAVAYVIVTTPPLRRLALAALSAWLGAAPTAYVAGEIQRAWAASARTGA